MTLKDHQITHIKNWQASGLTQAAYCQKHNLKPKTFSRWFRSDQISKSSEKPTLIPVVIQPTPTPSVELLRLHLANGQLLEIPSTVSPHWLADFLQCLA